MGTIFMRELKGYYQSMTGYLFAAFLLVFAGVYTMAYNLNFGYPNFEMALKGMCFVFMIAVPVLTMRGIAEERRQKTDQLLYSLPISLSKVVWGKYLAMLTVFALPVLIMCFYPLILSQFWKMNFFTCYSALIGFFFLGAAFISMGLFVSSLTENQAVSAVLCFLVLLLNFFLTSLTEFVSTSASSTMLAFTVIIIALALLVYSMTKNILAGVLFFGLLEGGLLLFYRFRMGQLSGLLPKLMNALSLFDRFENFVDGVFDITALVFYAAVIFIFQFFTVQSMEKRRWI